MFNYVNSVLATSTYAFVGVDGVTPTYSTNFPKITSNGLVLSLTNQVVSSTTAVIGDFSSIVTSAISDGVGGFYVGGTFTTVGGATHTRIAHILLGGAVDSSFTGAVTGGNILAMTLSSDRSTLYIGGSFTTVNGVARASIAALNAATGATISAFSPTITGSGVSAFALSSDNSTLYTGGTFTVIGGQNRANIAALNTSDGTAVAAFNPGASSTVSALALNSNGSTIYAAGSFTGLAGVARNHAGAVSTSNGALQSFNPTTFVTGTITSIALTSNEATLYVGGSFTAIGGQSRNRIAALNISDGTATSFNPNAQNGTVSQLILSADESKLYIAGTFTNIGGITSWNSLGSVNTSDGSGNDLSWFARNNGNANVIALSSDETNLFAGGGFTVSGGQSIGPFKFFPATGIFDTTFTTHVDDMVDAMAISPDGTKLYIGGQFLNISYTPRTQLGAVNVSTGALISAFNPTLNGDVYATVLSHDGSILYIAGRFTTVNGVTRNHVAAVNTSDGSLVSGFDPNVDAFTPAMIMTADGTKLYIGGDFLNVGGTGRSHIAEINTSDGSLVSSFNPGTTGNVRSLTLSPDESVLYMSGNFTQIAGVNRGKIGAVNTSDGSLVSAFNPNANALVRTIILYPDGTGNTLWATGQFTTIGGVSRVGLASIKTSDGSLNSFAQSSPIIDAGVGIAITPDLAQLIVGNGINSAGVEYLQVFTDPSIVFATPPTVTTSAASSITDTGATLNGNITATGGANPTVRGFVYGLTTAYGATTTEAGSFSTGAYTGSVSSLTCNTTYHFKAYATNTAGSGYSTDSTFTTSACSGGGGSGSSGGGIVLSAGSSHQRVTSPPVTTTTPITLPPTSPLLKNPIVQNTLPPTSEAPSNSNAPIALANAPGQNKDKTKDKTAPQNVHATTPDPTHVTLTWDPPIDPTTVVGFKIKRNGDPIASILSSTTTPSTSIRSTPESSPSGVSVAALVLPITQSVPPPVCLPTETVVSTSTTYISDGTTQVDGHNSVPVTFHHTSWTANVPGAGWIWSEDPLSNPVATTTKVFTKKFTINGTPKDAALTLAADNSFSLAVNGRKEAEDLTGYNYRAPTEKIVIPAADLVYGVNTLTFVVTNFYMKGGTYELNPAGLTYSLKVQESDCPSSLKIPNEPPVTTPIPHVATSTSTPKTSTSTPITISTSTPFTSTSTPATTPSTTSTSTPEVLSYTDSDLNPSSVYSYTVASVDAQGNILSESDPVIVTTPTDAPSNPSAPYSQTRSNTVVSVLRVVFGSILAASDVVTTHLPGASKAVPALLPIIPSVVALSSQLADVIAALPISDGIAGWLAQFVDFVLSLLGFHRRKNHLGVVFDSLTGEPVGLAYVTLHNASTGERVSVSVSDQAGAYGFFVKPGRYIMRVAKMGYAFPSAEKNLGLSFAGLYESLYHGEAIEVRDEAEVVGRNIAMDRTSSYKRTQPLYIHKGLRQFYNFVAGLIFILGIISSIHNVLTEPGVTTILVALFYFVVLLWSFFHTREWGRVYEKRSKFLLRGLLVELMTTGPNSKIIDRTITDYRGRFFLHGTWGKYLVKVYVFGDQRPIAMKEVHIGREGVVNKDLAV